jgi:predicted RNA binding protein YcfA (HicA-like mRNA interferase family)
MVCIIHTNSNIKNQNPNQVMNSLDVIKILKEDGWLLVATKGSHNQYKHPMKKGRVTVPHPKKDIPPGTLISIFKQADLDKKKFKKR